MQSADSALFYGLLLYILILPLPFGGDWPWAMGMYQVCVFLLTIAWLSLYLRGQVIGSRPLRKAKWALVFFGLWLLYLSYQAGIPATGFHGFVTVAPYLSQSAWLMSLAYALTFFLVLALATTRRRIIQLCTVIIIGGLFQAMYGSLMTLSGLEYSFFVEKTTYRGVATGTFYNRNHYAAWLVMCLAVGIGLMIARLDTSEAINVKDSIRKWLLLLLSPKLRLRLYLVIMVIALVLTHSRMGNAAFFASLLIAGVIGLALSRQAGRGTVILLTSLIVIDIFIVGAWFGIDKVADRLERTSVETEVRIDVNRVASVLWQDNLLTGTGISTFPMVFPRYRDADTGSGFYREAHNDYLQFAVETGVIGMVLLALIVVPSLVIALLAQYQRRDPLMRGVSFAAIMGITAMLIHATVEFNFQIPPNASLFVILLALAWIARFHRTEKGDT